MTIHDINTTKKHKLSMYLSMHLEDKRYVKINNRKGLSFTEEEARAALLKALKASICKRDAKEFLACLRKRNG